MMVQKKRKTGQNKKTEHKNRRWLALLLIGVLVLPVLGQTVVAQETGGQKRSQIQKGSLRKAVNKGLNLEKENESIQGESVPQEKEQPPAEAASSGEEAGDTIPSEEKTNEITETPEAVSPAGETDQVDGEETSPEPGKVRSRRSASSRGEQRIYEKHYRYSSLQDAYMDVYWDPATKRLRGHSRYASASAMGSAAMRIALAGEGDKRSSVYKYYPPYTQSMEYLESGGKVVGFNYGETWRIWGGSSYTYQAHTGGLLYLERTSGNFYWNGQKRYDDRMGIAYTQPGAPGNSEHFKILADGTIRRENSPNFLASETTLAYLNATLKVHENDMAVLGDNFITRGGGDEKIRMRLTNASGGERFNRTTQTGQTYYDTFKDIQSLRFENGDRLEITDYFSQKMTEYTYNSSSQAFELKKDNVPSDTYLIQLIGESGEGSKGYDLAIEGSMLQFTRAKGEGSILHTGWGGKVFLAIGIFKANGDLKKNAMILGGNHTLSRSSEVANLKETNLEDGDEIVIYAVKDGSWDESSKVRVLGDVKNAMPELGRFEAKPGFNTKVLRYNAATNKLSQEDGRIAGMEGALKSTVEEKLEELTLNPESNGDKKAWLLGLYSDAQIGFGNKNIQKLTGLEYGVNMTNVSVSDNQLKRETYQSLRNLKKMEVLNIGNIGLQGNEKAMTDILVNLPGLRTLYAGYNGLTNVTEFNRLRQLIDLNLEYNSIYDLSPLKAFPTLGQTKTLQVNNQAITESNVTILRRASYVWMNPVVYISGVQLSGVRNILPAGKGTSDTKKVTWSNLDLGNTELSYEFVSERNEDDTQVNFTGKLKRPAQVVDDAIITLNPNGGTIKNSSIHMVKGETAGEKLNPDVAGVAHPRGYTFAGWYRNDAGRGAEVKIDTPINEDMTLYAKWEPPAGEYMIQLNGGTSSIGYDVILKDGTITAVILKRGGDIIHNGWGGKVYLSMGIFKSNGDLKKKAAMLGGNHTISSASETGSLQGTVLENGDEIAIYAVKDTRWDEADKVRIIGDVEGGMPQLPGTDEKPGLNTKIFRYNATAKKLSQVDGSIAGMEGVLKSTVEEKLEELTLNPESNGDKKAWLLGLYSDAQIGFGNKNIQKLTGLEYGVNMTNVSVSDNQLKPETYQSLRNLKEITQLNIGRIGLKGNEKIMIDILVSLPGLRTLYTGYNGLTNVTEFQRLHQVSDLNLGFSNHFFLCIKRSKKVRFYVLKRV